MSENFNSRPPVNETAHQNMEVLAQSELAPFALQAYESALTLDPRLQDVIIKPIPSYLPNAGKAVPAWQLESGRYEVHVRLDGVNNTEKLDQLLQVPGARELFASQLGIEPEAITPEIMNIHALLHELGHARDYLDFENNGSTFEQERRDNYAALPAGPIPLSVLMDPGSLEHAGLETALQQGKSINGATTLPEVYAQQFAAYRQMRDESLADTFAVEVLARNPNIVQALSSSEVEAYRATLPSQPEPNYPDFKVPDPEQYPFI